MLQYLRDLYEGVKDMLRDEAPLPPTQRPVSANPLPPAAAKPAPPVPLTTARASLPPLKNWAHPFGDKSNPLVQLTNLAKAVGGYYPVGRNGLWHGGVHFDSGTASAMDQSHVRCLADGEVVAYRIATQTPITVYHTMANEVIQAPFASGFVLVRHHLQAPKLENNNDTPPSLIFYSLYMHLQDWASYEGDPKMARPAFWKSGSYRVKADATDPGPLGTSVYAKPSPGSTVLKTLPRGTAVTISGTGDYRKLVRAEGIDLPPLGSNNPALGYVRMDALEDKAGRYTVKDDALGKEKGEHLNIHAEAKAKSKVIATLPRGTEVLTSGEGEYRKLERVLTPGTTGPGQDDFQQSTGYVRFSALESVIAPHQLDTVAILQPPIAIKAGALIGHLGPYQSGKPAPAQYKLHLETFTAEDLPKFFENSRAWAQRLPEKEKTWLKLPKGTQVITAEQGSEPPSVLRLGTPSGHDLLVPRSLLDGLRASDKRVVAGEAYNWYRLEGLLHDADDKPLDGWVCEKAGATPWVSPWHWEGYDTIRDVVPLDIFKAHSLYIKGALSDEETERLRPRIDARDKSPVIARLYDIIDKDHNGDLSPDEIKSALAIPAKAQSISQLAIEYESEWNYRQAKWDELDDVLGHTPSTPLLNWMAEKERIRELKWWGDVAGRVGLPENGRVYHLHPIGLLGSLRKQNRCYCYEQGIVDSPCESGVLDVTKDHFEKLSAEIGVEKEVLRAIAVAETGDKVPFREYVPGERHAFILYERHYMRRFLLENGGSLAEINSLSQAEPTIVHTYESQYSYGSYDIQYSRLLRARELDFDAANKSCSWGKFQVMGEYYGRLYKSTAELVDAQNKCALQHLQYYKVFLTKEKNLVGPMKARNWLQIAQKYNGMNQIGYDVKIKDAYESLKKNW